MNSLHRSSGFCLCQLQLQYYSRFATPAALEYQPYIAPSSVGCPQEDRVVATACHDMYAMPAACLLQGEIFAAEGYAKTTGDVGVCIATSGPGATNLVTGLADALLDSVPMVAITGQVPRKMIGTDAFQETPIVEVTRQITKHNYLVMQIEDLPRCAFHLTSTILLTS